LTEQPNDQTSNVTENEVSEPPEQTTMVLWDINHTSSLEDPTEEEEPPEILVVQTRIKGTYHTKSTYHSTSSQKSKKNHFFSSTTPILSSTPKFQTQETSKLEYNVVEDLKKMKENIFVMDLCRIPQQKDLLLQALKEDDKPKFKH
jgi:hypothetical protein